jgi:hypothetical protein
MTGFARRFAAAVSFVLLSGLYGFAPLFQVEVINTDLLQLIPLLLVVVLSGLNKLGMLLNQKRLPLSLPALVFWVIVIFMAPKTGAIISAQDVYSVFVIMTIIWWILTDVVEFILEFPRHANQQ